MNGKNGLNNSNNKFDDEVQKIDEIFHWTLTEN